MKQSDFVDDLWNALALKKMKEKVISSLWETVKTEIAILSGTTELWTIELKHYSNTVTVKYNFKGNYMCVCARTHTHIHTHMHRKPLGCVVHICILTDTHYHGNNYNRWWHSCVCLYLLRTPYGFTVMIFITCSRATEVIRQWSCGGVVNKNIVRWTYWQKHTIERFLSLWIPS